ncbi:carbohydrate kinase [Mobiluncus mulieris]|uniref:Carbohydrate kinase n=1 Tax=Mobiluncus mulieris TaxID=2052 RepID=A0A848RBN1_9ACTO|nr:FGGY-family carbohydrate kinase [Mobiluncus mulieris]NMW92699.1 carbohydrate kinase [Mobiluncus mulieris]
MLVLSYDVGTSGVKTCLYQSGESLSLVASALDTYDLTIFPDGGAEQDPEEWWRAIVTTTQALRETHPQELAQVAGISFCSQMQGLVLVDATGQHLRPAMSYLDQRATKQKHDGLETGFKISGMNAKKLLSSLYRTSAVSASVKDPMWKYLWVKENEPEVMARTRWWLDVKEYLIGRMTRRFIMSLDSAFATLLLDVRAPQPVWAARLARSFGVNPAHLPPIVPSTEAVGTLRPEIAAELGVPDTAVVYAGGGDASLIGVGAGACTVGATHAYWGTSGWVSTVTDRRVVDTGAMIATVDGADCGKYNYFAELETAGKCFEWVRKHLAEDEINVYLSHHDQTEDTEHQYRSLYDYLSKVISCAKPGADGVIFTPWLHGNRCPFEDANARAMFFNISLETGKTELLRAVIEGVCFQLRWFLETQERKVNTSKTLRFVGGGALSPVTCQILADILGRQVETVASPQNVGSVGAALVALVGAGEIRDLTEATSQLVKPNATYHPNPATRAVYDRQYAVFKTLYRNNRQAFTRLNAAKPGGATRETTK